MTSPAPQPPSTPHPPITAPDILNDIRTQIETNIPASVDRSGSEYLRSALEAFKSAIDELDVWILRIQSKISGIEMQLPTVVHEYDGERRGKLEGRLRILTGEREELRTVRAALVGDQEDTGRRLEGMGYGVAVRAPDGMGCLNLVDDDDDDDDGSVGPPRPPQQQPPQPPRRPPMTQTY